MEQELKMANTARQSLTYDPMVKVKFFLLV